MMVGWYYLHSESNDLIYKRELGETHADLRESPFVKAMWSFDPANRADAWNILVEALSIGAPKKRIDELASLWCCDDEDAQHYSALLEKLNLEMDGDKWVATRSDFINLQESPIGFGDTCLEAMAELCENLGFIGGKMWNKTFADLIQGPG